VKIGFIAILSVYVILFYPVGEFDIMIYDDNLKRGIFMRYRKELVVICIVMFWVVFALRVSAEKVTKPGTVRVVIKLEGIRYDGKTGPEYIDNCTIPNGELTEDEIRAREQKDKKFYTGNTLYAHYYNLSTDYTPNRPSIKEDCAGHTTWLLRHWLKDPSIPKIRMGGSEFATHILYPFTEGEKTGRPAEGDIACWGEVPAHENPADMHHITLVKQVKEKTMILESKNRIEAVWDYETEFKLNGNTIWNIYNPMHKIEGGTKGFLYGKPHATATWFYWTPNWVDSGKGINLTGKWQVKGNPNKTFEIDQQYRVKVMPLSFKKDDGTTLSFGAFQGPYVIYRRDWNSRDISYVRAGDYTQDEIRWRDLVGPGENAKNPPETWVRVPVSQGFQKGDSLKVEPRFASAGYESIDKNWDDIPTSIRHTATFGNEQYIEWKCSCSRIRPAKKYYDQRVENAQRNLNEKRAETEKSNQYERTKKTKYPPIKHEFADRSEYDTGEVIINYAMRVTVPSRKEVRQEDLISYVAIYREEFIIFIRLGYHDTYQKDYKPELRRLVENTQKLIDSRFTNLKPVRKGHNRILKPVVR
jgi:hypothetical protein